MINKTCILSIIFSGIFFCSNAQVDSLRIIDSTMVDDLLTACYEILPHTNFPGGILNFKQEDFNPGIVSDPFLLIQGKTPGVQIYNRGGDPNVQSVARVRGFTTAIGQRQPLIVIDGIPNSNIEQLDPNDIEQISILKDGSYAAVYGIRANQGVVLITTKSAKETDGKLKVNFTTSTGISNVVEGINILNAQEYLETGKGVNEGTSTDWIDVIHRTTPSYTGQLAFSGYSEQIDYRISANYRKVNGVLINSDFTKLNARANLNGRFLDDKLKVKLNAGFTSLDQNYSYQEAVRLANNFNPTAPVFGEDALLPFNSEQFGGYFELLNIFNVFNPLSVIEQNQNVGNQNLLNVSSLLSYNLSKKTTANVRLAHQSVSAYQREYNPTTSYYRGNANFPLNQGRGFFRSEEQSFSLADIFVSQKMYYRLLSMKLTGGAFFRVDNLDNNAVEVTGFTDDVLDIRNSNSVNQKVLSAQEIQRINRAIPNENTSAFYLSANSKYNGKYFLNATIRTEGSSKLSKDNNWGTFFGLGIGVETMARVREGWIKILNPRVSLSRTGGIPVERGLSNDLVVNVTNTNGVVVSNLQRAGNENLRWESKDELNVGIDFGANRIYATLDWYTRKTKDIITSQFVDPAIFGTFNQFDNLMDVRSSGIELNAKIDVIKKSKFNYSANFMAATYKTIVTQFRDPIDLGGSFSGPGFGSTLAIRIKEGNEFGEIFGPVFVRADVDGAPIYEDVNNDGQVIVNVDQTDDLIDFAVLGNAMPDVELGWNNTFRIGTMELGVFFRSAVGHSKINSYRVFHEVIFDQPAFTNYVRTELYNPDVKFLRYNSLYVEKASFLKLDNIRLTKNIEFNGNHFVSNLSISLVGQNLITWTNYTGTDPEPAIVDNQISGFNLGESEVLFPGFDRRNQYNPAKTFSLNVQVGF